MQRVIPIRSMADVFCHFSAHSVVKPLAEAWRQAFVDYNNGGHNLAALNKARDACLDAVAAWGQDVTFNVDEARTRDVRGDAPPDWLPRPTPRPVPIPLRLAR